MTDRGGRDTGSQEVRETVSAGTAQAATGWPTKGADSDMKL